MSISQISREAGALSLGAVAICVGEVSGGAQIAGIAVINLAAIWRDLKSQCSTRTRREAEEAVRAALEASREFRADDLATAGALLDSLPRDVSFEPARTADLLGEDRFVTDTAAELVRLLRPDPDTPAIGRILTLALEAGLAACAESVEFRQEMAWPVSLSTLQAIVRVERRMFDLTDTILAQHEDLRASYEETLIQMARRIAIDVEDRDSALAELDRAVGIVQRLETEGHRPSNHPDFIDAVFAEVARLNRDNEIDAAADALQAVLEREREETVARQIKLLDGLIDQHTLRRDVDATVKAELDKLALEGGGFEDLRRVRNVLYERGRDKGLRFDLEVSIGLARAEVARGSDADARGKGWNDLGIALATLGERNSGPARLEEAVAAYRSALQEWTSDRVPLDWATAQNNLGNAFAILGARDSGPARLEEAVDAYRSALQERTRVRAPLGWAMTQNNLGNALRNLGERESCPSRLEEAVDAFRSALQVRTRSRVPLDWATTQNNLGNALRNLGERDSGTARLEEALDAYKSALQERDRERTPLNWAGTHQNIALAELAFADHPATEAPCPHLRRALDHVDTALEVFDPDATSFRFEEATRLRDRLVAQIAQDCGGAD